MTLSSDFKQILVTGTRYLVDSSSQTGLSEHESLVENRHLGWLVVTDRSQRLLYCTPGASEIATFFRSSAKPFQAYPLVKKGIHAELTTDELAIACASHTGSQMHTSLAHRILTKAGLPEESLQCGPHAPIDAGTQEQLRQTGSVPSRIHNNCSGKHAAMLLYCQRLGLDTTTYLDPRHPLQQEILDALKQWGRVSSIPLAIDGCGAPVFYLPLQTMALLYAHLGSTPEFQPLCAAMTSYPEVVGGQGRVDTVLMQASQGRLLAKVGADGVLCVSHVGSGEGLALKLADGSGEIRDLTLVHILYQLGWLDENTKSHPDIVKFLDKKRRLNTQNKIVGEFQVHFQPGE